MIIIFSKKRDQSTNDVVRILVNMNKSFIRINEDVRVEIFINVFDKNKSCFIIEGTRVKFTEITSIWLRKGDFFKSMKSTKIETLSVAEFILNEERIFYSVLHNQLDDKRSLNSFNQVYFNKFKALQYAINLGINVPMSIITNSKKLVMKATKKNKILTKPLFNIVNPKSKLSMLTRLINEYDTKGLPNTFYPSLIQEYISSIYEIRSVYLLGEIYSCILVPRYKKDNLPDYRGSIYGDLGLEPITTNESLQQKITLLMDKLKINFCSLDILVDKNEQYYLIDVNPFGQYGMVSVKYNDIIDLKIVKYLVNE